MKLDTELIDIACDENFVFGFDPEKVKSPSFTVQRAVNKQKKSHDISLIDKRSSL